ncbi:MAG TPA: hypothetical protein VKU42_01640, partial [Candidatus Angelobacter sp.]|nr:hypothetical protein [Candidatus Angelobacter sp.]
MDRSLRFTIWALVGIAVFSQAAMAQRSAGSNGSLNSSKTNSSGRTNPSGLDNPNQPMFVSGKVLLEGGGLLPEPVAIERSCNGLTR